MDGSRLLALSTTQLWHIDAVRGPSTPSSPWAEGPRDARCRPAGALPGGHAEGPSDALGEASDRSAVARGPTRRAGQAVGARRRALRSGAKPRPRRQGAGNAAAPVEAVVGAAPAAVEDAADA